ncbi:MAG: hypothetical protein OXQ94_10215, partial [Gemmatimonadota bacterium]|nr:hypothetical protein [Gemmatimonadota bacterium]MDE2872041.1 hypothetical protein [Gemmatimonadota bacterium]
TDVQYTTRVTAGTGTPSIGGRNVPVPLSAPPGGGPDFIAAPSGEFWLDRAIVWTHQLRVRVPMR